MIEAPHVVHSITSSVQDEIHILTADFKSAAAADDMNRRRGIRNMTGYMNDVVPDRLKNYLRQEGRSEKNFSLLLYMVKGHLGNAMMNWFDPRLIAREGDPLDATEALERIWYQQKDQHNYKTETMSCLENGYIYRGIQELKIVRPTINPRTWGIAFPNQRPEMFVDDPSNITDKIFRNSEVVWKCFYLSAKDMVDYFPKKHDDILRALVEQDKNGVNYEEITRDAFANIDRATWCQKHLVTEYYHFKRKRVYRQFLRDGRTEIPQTGYEFGSVEDVITKKQWAMAIGIQDLNDDMVITVQDWKIELWRTTFCPRLGIVLDDQPDERQLDGKMPFYGWSFLTKNGMSFGLVDFIWDAQQEFNNVEMAKNKIKTRSPIAGKPWIRKEMFAGDEHGFRDAVENYTDPSVPLVIPENAPPAQEGFGVIQGTNIPPALLQDETFKLRLIEIIGYLPPTLQGRTGNSAESGVGIGRKVIEANVMLRGENESIVQHEKDKTEDWVKMGIQMFGHPSQMNRVFVSANGKERTIINELIGFDANGNDIIRNHIAKLTRPEVIISQTRENDYMRQARREMTVGGLQAMPPSPTNALNRAVLEYNLVINSDYANDADRELAVGMAKKQLAIVERMTDMQAGIQAQPPGGPGAPGGAPGGVQGAGAAPAPGGPVQPMAPPR